MKFAGYSKVDIEEEKLFFRFFGNLVLQNSRVLVNSSWDGSSSTGFL